jgi:hypothetical protein
MSPPGGCTTSATASRRSLPKHGADGAALDSILNHASSATRSGVIGTYQHPTLVEPMRKVMALWDQPLSEELPIDALTQPPR